MKKLIKFILGLALSVVALVALYVLLNFLYYLSDWKTHYECKGVYTEGENVSGELFLTIEEYSPFEFARGSSGRARIEIPGVFAAYYYSHIEGLGDLIHIYYDSPPNYSELKGSFSLVSKDLLLDTPYSFFDGRCKKINI